MSDQTQAAGSLPLSAVRMAKDLIRRYNLRGNAQILVIDRNPGGLVARFRSAGLMAFGLYDGAAPPRDPQANGARIDPSPEIQPVVLHQSIPFLAQSFDCVVLGDSSVYRGSLKGPEACTATANLLACLKPSRPLVYSGPVALDAMQRHLSDFPGEQRLLKLGTGGIEGLLRRLIGRERARPHLQFTIPGDAISRLAWHRFARQAVTSSQRQPAA